eukprot:Rhum_TRINITY_DN7757_c0_g1::Rhum_TRINITY_DN7757_c0_g1_i1::g.24581::m.24581
MSVLRSAASLRRQTRLCSTHMYSKNFTDQAPTRAMFKSHKLFASRDPMNGSESQKHDPDWKAPRHSGGVAATQKHLQNQTEAERILAYKLERMDYSVYEAPHGTAPPPPMKELMPRVTLDML